MKMTPLLKAFGVGLVLAGTLGTDSTHQEGEALGRRNHDLSRLADKTGPVQNYRGGAR